jgi:hypothetical protein
MRARPPLFIPLKTEHFNGFKSGRKPFEMRPYGPRWNERTCYRGRPAVISKGYGKHERLNAIIAVAEFIDITDLADQHATVFRSIYPQHRGKVAVIYFDFTAHRCNVDALLKERAA